MYHYHMTYWPQSSPFFAVVQRPPAKAESQAFPEAFSVRANGSARTDEQIAQDVRDELEMEPAVRANAIDIHVKDGVVALSGVVDGAGERWLAESAARRIAGVTAVSARLTVFSPELVPADDDIVHDCERVLRGLMPKADYAIVVMVSHGWVTLLGSVAKGYERRIAESEVASLLSVHGVNSQIKVRHSPR